MDINKLAIIINRAGGFDEAENLTGVDADLLQRAIAGESLPQWEQDKIENAINYIYEKTDIPIHDIDDLTEDLDYLYDFPDDLELADVIRESIAKGNFDPEALDETTPLLKDLTHGARQKFFDVLLNDEKQSDIAIQKILEDRASGANTWDDVNDSLFWAWFREVFYGE